MTNPEHPIGKYLVKHIPKNPQGVVLIAMQHFSVSRTTVLRHLGYLVKAGQVIKTGVSKQTRYALKSSAEQHFRFTCEPMFDEFKVFNQFVSSTIKAAVNKNAYDVAEYTVTEMLNNAKDHSQGRTITMSVELTADCLHIVIEDDGVGIFKKIQQECHFEEAREALFVLLLAPEFFMPLRQLAINYHDRAAALGASDAMI